MSERALEGHTGVVQALAACAGGSLASGSEDQVIKIWSAHSQDRGSDAGGGSKSRAGKCDSRLMGI